MDQHSIYPITGGGRKIENSITTKEICPKATVRRVMRTLEPLISPRVNSVSRTLLRRNLESILGSHVRVVRSSIGLGHLPNTQRWVRLVFIQKMRKKDFHPKLSQFLW